MKVVVGSIMVYRKRIYDSCYTECTSSRKYVASTRGWLVQVRFNLTMSMVSWKVVLMEPIVIFWRYVFYHMFVHVILLCICAHGAWIVSCLWSWIVCQELYVGWMAFIHYKLYCYEPSLISHYSNGHRWYPYFLFFLITQMVVGGTLPFSFFLWFKWL